MDVHSKLAELRSIVANARAMPMSASCVVNRDETLAAIDELADMMSQAFSEADRVLAERDRVVAEGHDEAGRIIAGAEQERERILSDTEVYRIALREAEQLRTEVREEAEALRRETDDYVDAKLATFEISLNRTLEAVSRGRERLRGRSELDALRGADADAPPLPGEDDASGAFE